MARETSAGSEVSVVFEDARRAVGDPAKQRGQRVGPLRVGEDPGNAFARGRGGSGEVAPELFFADELIPATRFALPARQC